jgi:hypothetical protein
LKLNNIDIDWSILDKIENEEEKKYMISVKQRIMSGESVSMSGMIADIERIKGEENQQLKEFQQSLYKGMSDILEQWK